MSWFSSNYEKILLGGGVAIALGVIYAGWTQLGAVDEEFGSSLKGSGNDNAAVEGHARIPKAMESMKSEHGLKQGDDDGRPVDLFTGVPLFIKRDAPKKAIDLLKGEEVHPGIPNAFWLDNGIDPGFADTPMRDPDGDGFSNKEEHLGQTDPMDEKSHPELVVKLRYIKDESLAWVLRPGYGSNGAFPLRYEDGLRRKNKADAGNMVSPGQTFFADEPMKGRFKLLGHEVRKELNPAINMEVETTFVRIEDLKSNKTGVVYEFPAPLGRAQQGQYTKFDRSAVLRLQALGEEGKEVVIEENTKFSLPFGGKEKKYLLKEVSPQFILVEYPDQQGTAKVVRIPQAP